MNICTDRRSRCIRRFNHTPHTRARTCTPAFRTVKTNTHYLQIRNNSRIIAGVTICRRLAPASSLNPHIHEKARNGSSRIITGSGSTMIERVSETSGREASSGSQPPATPASGCGHMATSSSLSRTSTSRISIHGIGLRTQERSAGTSR